MKSVVKKLWEYIGGINGIIIIVYCFFVLFGYEFLHFPTRDLFFTLPLSLLLLFICCPKLLRQLKKIKITYSTDPSLREKILFFLIFFLATFSTLMFYFAAYFPGGFNPDSLSQLRQAINNEYSNWHPYLHTIFAFKLPLVLTNGAIWSIPVFQILCFSLAVGYTGTTLLKFSDRIFSCFAVLFIIINPVICGSVVYAIKDTFVGIFALCIMSFVLRIYFSKGEWATSWKNIVAFSVVLVALTLFRHNAILFTFPLFIVVLIFLNKSVKIRIIAMVLSLFFIMYIPLPIILNVEQPGQRQVESLGLPLTILGDIYCYDRNSLDDETRNFMSQIADEEKWNNYVQGNFNSIKWKGINSDVIEKKGALNVIQMSIKAASSSPGVALSSALTLTGLVYKLDGDAQSGTTTHPYIESNEFNISWNGVNQFYNALERYRYLFEKYLSLFFLYIGTANIVVLYCTFSKCNLKKKEEIKKALFVLPLFLYNFGTMLLLTGPDYRFFLFSILLLPIYILLMFRDNSQKQVNCRFLKSVIQ